MSFVLVQSISIKKLKHEHEHVPHNIPLAINGRVMTFLQVSTFALVKCMIFRGYTVFLPTISEFTQYFSRDKNCILRVVIFANDKLLKISRI